MQAIQPELLVSGGELWSNRWLLVDDRGKVAGLAESPPEGAERVLLPGRLLLPGLVNAHSHAFQRLLRGRTEFLDPGHPTDDFWSWRERMYRAAESLTPEEIFLASRQAFVEMALAGITTVGEFHYLHHQADGTPYAEGALLAREVIRAAREVGLNITLLRVAYARAGHDVAPNPRQRRFIDAAPDVALAHAASIGEVFRDDAGVKVGLAPHSVRAVPREWLEAFASTDLPLHMHVAEQPKEIEACIAEHRRRPVELLSDVGLLTPRFTAVHGVHLASSEVALLGAARATVCACPSTERNLGDGVVPADALLNAGARIALGSDSHAAIDLLDEARQLEGNLRLLRLRRAVLDPGEGSASGLALRLLDCATASGASSLGWVTGRLAEGEPADFFTVPLDHPSLAGCDPGSVLAALLVGTAHAPPREVHAGGRWIVRDGVHPLAREAGEAFARVSRRLYA